MIAALLNVFLTHQVVIRMFFLPFQFLPLLLLSFLLGPLLISYPPFLFSLFLQIFLLLSHKVRESLDTRLVQPVDDGILACRDKDLSRQFGVME